MSADDDLDNLLSGLESNADDESPDSGRADSDAEDKENGDSNNEHLEAEEYTSMTFESNEGSVTQAEVYDNLKRIGELEDDKQRIQDELRERTEQLCAMLKHIDRGSILYKMLLSAIPGSAPHSSSARSMKKHPHKLVAKAPVNKAVKVATPAVKEKPAKKKTATKKASKKAPKKKSRR